jgi:hypothetical protein
MNRTSAGFPRIWNSPKLPHSRPSLRYALLLICLMGSLTGCVWEAAVTVSPTELPTVRVAPTAGGNNAASPTSSVVMLLPDAQEMVPTLTIPTPLHDKPQPSTDWMRNWLHSIPCSAPCWEGITPGQTRVIDAVEQLNQSALVTRLRLHERLNADDDDQVFWDWIAQDAGGGSFHYPQQPGSQIIAGTRVVFPTLFRLQEIVTAYGSPSHIVPSAAVFRDPHSTQATVVYNLVVIYLSRGFYLTLSDPSPVKPILSPDLLLHGDVTFFTPTSAGLNAAVPPGWWDSTDLVPWQGFQDFDWYCQQAKTSPHQVCK